MPPINDFEEDCVFTIPALQHRHFLSADEWAEENVILRDSGRLRYDETPWMREPTRVASDVYRYCRVVMSTPAQSAKSQAIINIICHQAVFHPANTMLLLDSEVSARRLIKNRLKPSLRDFAKVPSLQKGQTAGVVDVSAEINNIALATGANLIAASARSVSSLASTPIQLLCLDEVDRYEKDLSNEGDPITLALKRTLRYKNSMVIMTSTPTIPDGRITKYYELGTQEVWSVKCSSCGVWMPVLFDDIDFSGTTPTYFCPNCGVVYSENDVKKLVHGYSNPNNDKPYADKIGRIARSFKVTAPLVHSAYTWESIEAERKQAEAIGLPAVRSWRNVTVGEPFVPPSVSVDDYSGLISHRLNYTKTSLPSFVRYVVAGVDTQDSRFELVVIGFSEDTHKIAVIEHKIIFGELLSDFEPWNNLKDFLSNARYTTTDGVSLPIALTMIDAGGHATQEVYALGLQTPFIRPVRGRSYRMNEEETSIIDRVQRKSVTQIGRGTGRVDLTWVNTRFVKDAIYFKLSEIIRNKDVGLYFSAAPDALLDENFFEQLTSEEKYETAKGYSMYKPKVGMRNECLDCMVYALAGVETVRLSLCKMPSIGGQNGIKDVQFSEPVSVSKDLGTSDVVIQASKLSNNITSVERAQNVENSAAGTVEEQPRKPRLRKSIMKPL